MSKGDKRKDKRGKVWIIKDFLFQDGPWMRPSDEGDYAHVMRDDGSTGKFVKRNAFERNTVAA